MIRSVHIAAVVLCIVAAPRSVSAQENDAHEVEIAFDSLAGSRVDGVQVFRAINARLRQGDTRLRADRMSDEGSNTYLFEGNVRVVQDADTIYADLLHYRGDDRVGNAKGRVRLTDGTIHMWAPEATYFGREKRTRFDRGVVLADSLLRLVADTGTYWSGTERALFWGRVQLTREHIYLESDSLFLRRKEHQMDADGHVFFRRSAHTDGVPTEGWNTFSEALVADAVRIAASETPSDGLLLFGDHFFTDEKKDSTRVSGTVTALETTSDSTAVDSLWISSMGMTFESLPDSLERLTAEKNVRLESDSFEAAGEELVYERNPSEASETSTGILVGTPSAWIDSTRVVADSLEIRGSGSAIDTLFATGQVFIADRDSVTGRVRQIRGRRLVASFQSDSIRTMVVSPNAEALYFMKDDNGEETGAVRASADRIVLTFQDGAASDIRVYTGVEGTFFPDEQLDNVQNLAGYSDELFVPQTSLSVSERFALLLRTRNRNK